MGDINQLLNQQPAGPPEQPSVVGTGQIKVGLILPLSAGGNAGVAAQSMKNAAEMALAEFNNPDIQLLAKDDGGRSLGASSATQQAISEGAEIILGPLFAQSVSATGQIARQSNRPVIAFSTDTNVASRGVYLLSFLPQSDVDRIVAKRRSVISELAAPIISQKTGSRIQIREVHHSPVDAGYSFNDGTQLLRQIRGSDRSE